MKVNRDFAQRKNARWTIIFSKIKHAVRKFPESAGIEEDKEILIHSWGRR